MIDNYVRERLPGLASPLIAVYRRLGLSPNTITLLGFALAMVATVLVANRQFGLALGVWLGSRVFDGTDGILARETDTATPFGAYLDIVFDMAAYSTFVIGLAAAFPELVHLWLVVLLLYVLGITSALALGAQEAATATAPRDNRGLRLGAGLAEAGETSVYYALCLLWPTRIEPLTWGWIAILAVTVVSRSALAWRSLAPRAT
ncbi:MAG: CDP-alcohol phosphatidyltransferase family protein [Deltaproteobacteria bacterium]|nr:CDP-alcohol phosphatidyltransferase family protein [Deltaproteobacteria bacterium]